MKDDEAKDLGKKMKIFSAYNYTDRSIKCRY